MFITIPIFSPIIKDGINLMETDHEVDPRCEMAAIQKRLDGRLDQKVIRFFKRAADAPPPSSNRIASPCFSI